MLTIFIAHFKTKMYKNFRWCEMSKSTIIAVAGKGGVGKTLFACIYLPMQTVEQENYKACKAAAYERGGLQKQWRTCYS